MGPQTPCLNSCFQTTFKSWVNEYSIHSFWVGYCLIAKTKSANRLITSRETSKQFYQVESVEIGWFLEYFLQTNFKDQIRKSKNRIKSEKMCPSTAWNQLTNTGGVCTESTPPSCIDVVKKFCIFNISVFFSFSVFWQFFFCIICGSELLVLLHKFFCSPNSLQKFLSLILWSGEKCKTFLR